MTNFAFIVPTCENNVLDEHSVCVKCVNSIQKFYPNTPIVIINDSPVNVASDEIILKYFNNVNVKVISPETKGSACSYAMNYLLDSSFDYGVVIHDSTELISYLPEFDFDFKFFWNFTEHYNWDTLYIPFRHRTQNIQTHTDEILDFYVHLDDSGFKQNFLDFYRNRDIWRGCMGNMLIISKDFLQAVENKTKICSLTKYVVTRRHRMVMESVFAMAVFYTKNINISDEFSYSLHGDWKMINDPNYCNHLHKQFKYINKYHLRR